MRLIDADKVAEAIAWLNEYDFILWNKIMKCIDKVPEVDAVPVVRCKDCKYFDHSDFGKGEEYWCKHFVSTDDYTHSHKVIEDDFCAWGERRIDETD